MPTIALIISLLLVPMTTFAATMAFHISTSESPVLKLNPYITDPTGVKAGYLENGTPTTTNLGGGYGVDRIDDDVDGSPGNAVMEILINPVRTGNYTVTLYGLGDTSYSIATKYRLKPGSRAVATFNGFIGSGATRTYSMTVADSNEPPVLVKNVTFDTLHQDLQSMLRLAQIGDKRFVDELEAILSQGEKALQHTGDDRDHHDGDDDNAKREAVAKLREFSERIERAAGEKSDHDHDKDAKRFITATAAQSLASDAKTLIQQLGGGKTGDHHDANHLPQ